MLRALSACGLDDCVCGGAGPPSKWARLRAPPACARESQELDRILRSMPYLDKQDHGLYQYILEASKLINAGCQPGAENALLTLSLEIQAEKISIRAAFKNFDHDGDGVLQKDELAHMLDYLGFPFADEDVRRFLAVVDTDGDGSVSYEEAINFVGAAGGSAKLYGLRRSQIEDRYKGAEGKVDKHALDTRLKGVGFTDDNLAYWRLTANPSEFDEVFKLKRCQCEALGHIRKLALQNHALALPKLLKRARTMGIPETDVHMALAWVRELAPIIIHIKLEKYGDKIARDTHYRNQFETSSSEGLLNTSARERWERGLFGNAYDGGARAFDRPKYGVQNVWNDSRGVHGCDQYGESYLILKDVRLRCTLSPEDSANLPARRLAVPDYYAHVMMEFSDRELREMVRVAKGGHEQVGDSKSVIEVWGKYKEAQIHGEIDLDKHVERLVVHEKHRTREAWVNGIAKAHGWKVTWMGDMRKELVARAGGREMDEKVWRDKLACVKREIDTIRDASTFLRDQEQTANVKWFYYFHGWQAFDNDYHGRMESLFQAYKASPSRETTNVKLKLRSGRMLLIDFAEMKQHVQGNPTIRPLKREEL